MKAFQPYAACAFFCRTGHLVARRVHHFNSAHLRDRVRRLRAFSLGKARKFAV
jgi:hypothetical protein